jgi:hypothetical protein
MGETGEGRWEKEEMLSYMREKKFICKNYELIPADNRTLLALDSGKSVFAKLYQRVL